MSPSPGAADLCLRRPEVYDLSSTTPIGGEAGGRVAPSYSGGQGDVAGRSVTFAEVSERAREYGETVLG